MSTVARARHPKPAVEKALQSAEATGWTVVPTTAGHRWGVASCLEDCQPISVWSTPKNPGSHAKDITRRVNKCPHAQVGEEDKR